MMWAYLLAFVLIGSAAAQIPKLGACPNVTVKPDFDATKFVGKWYEAQRYFAVFQLGGKCVTATYSANENGTIGVVNKQISSITGRPSSIRGYATQNENEKAKLSVVFPSLPFQVAAAYWVLDTDYDSFAVIWSCTSATVVSAKFAWLLTREQQPAESVLEKAYAVFDKNGIDRSSLRVTNQKNCPKDSENTA